MSLLKKIFEIYFPNFTKKYRFRKLLMKKINFGELYDHRILQSLVPRKNNHPNKFVRYGEKFFSQTDEDGLTLEIVKRLGIKEGLFAEFGVGNGTENNTIILAAQNWKGIWFGGEKLKIDLSTSNKVIFCEKWITKENIIDIINEGLNKFQRDTFDLISLDLDGNDFYFIETILSNGYLPSVFIVEYNGKFPPPINFKIDYNPNHIWNKDDYMGASLNSLDELFIQYNYKLICCNSATGSNAFYVHNKFAHLFPEVPDEIEKIFVKSNYFLPINYGNHPTSLKTLKKILTKIN